MIKGLRIYSCKVNSLETDELNTNFRYVESIMYITGMNHPRARTPPLFLGSLISNKKVVDYRVDAKGTGCS